MIPWLEAKLERVVEVADHRRQRRTTASEGRGAPVILDARGRPVDSPPRSPEDAPYFAVERAERSVRLRVEAALFGDDPEARAWLVRQSVLGDEAGPRPASSGCRDLSEWLP